MITMKTVILLILSIASILECNAEIRNFVGKLQATADFIHYSEGFIIAPGFIDISGLTFSVAVDVDVDGNSNRMLERMTQSDPAVSVIM